LNKIYIYWFAIIFVFLFTRLIGIEKTPIFNDEMLYMRWIQEIHDGYLMRPLDNGRQPLYLWIATMLDSFVHDESLSLRYVSVVAGFFSMIGLWFLAKKLFVNSAVSYITVVLYLIFPFTLLYDRFGVLDSMVTAAAIWSFNLSVSLLRNPKYLNSVILGFVIGLGLLTKSNALFSLLLLPLTSLLIVKSFSFKNLKKVFLDRKFITWIIYVVLAIGIAKVIELFIVMQPNYFRILGANGIFIYPIKEWIVLPVEVKAEVFAKNFVILGTWLYEYMGILLLFLITNLLLRNYIKERLLLFLYFAIPFITLCFFGRVMFPRYILPMVIFLIPLCAYSLFEVTRTISNKAMRAGLVTFLILPVALTSYYVLFDYQKSSIPMAEKSQYFIDAKIYSWVREQMEMLSEKSSKIPISITIDESALGFESMIEHGVYKKDKSIRIYKNLKDTPSDSDEVYIFTMSKVRVYEGFEFEEFNSSNLSNGTVLYLLKIKSIDNL